MPLRSRRLNQKWKAPESIRREGRPAAGQTSSGRSRLVSRRSKALATASTGFEAAERGQPLMPADGRLTHRAGSRLASAVACRWRACAPSARPARSTPGCARLPAPASSTERSCCIHRSHAPAVSEQPSRGESPRKWFPGSPANRLRGDAGCTSCRCWQAPWKSVSSSRHLLA